MAGMLPGVECARRRRIHQSGLFDSSSSITSTSSFGNSSRMFSSFSLYAPNAYESTHLSSMQRNPIVPQTVLDETAREAKERLDEKLNAIWKSPKTRGSKKYQWTPNEVSRATKVVSKRLSWVAKLRSNFWEGSECAVC